jgi:hypothetical protein
MAFDFIGILGLQTDETHAGKNLVLERRLHFSDFRVKKRY